MSIQDDIFDVADALKERRCGTSPPIGTISKKGEEAAFQRIIEYLFRLELVEEKYDRIRNAVDELRLKI